MTYSHDGLNLSVDHNGLSASFLLEPSPDGVELMFCVYECNEGLRVASERNRGTFVPHRPPHGLPEDIRMLLWVTVPAEADGLDHEHVRFEERV